MDDAPFAESRLRKPRLLWVGDAVVKSGFARVGHSVNEHLSKVWDVNYLGIGYDGNPHSYPYPIHVAKPYGKGDMFGIAQFERVCERVDPDVVLLNVDTYLVCGFLEVARGLKKRPMMVAYSPIDLPGIKSEIIRHFRQDGLNLFINYTEFGAKAIRQAGWTGLMTVIPHGVNNAFYRPLDRDECRRKIAPGIPEGAFVVGVVNRNQPRKRIDLAVIYFAEWLKQGGDGYLWLHCAKKDAGWDLVELARQLQIQDRVFMPGVQGIEDMPEEVLMPLFYSMLDVQVTTTLGEGWGLTTMEGMACGVPQIVPDWSALGEWTRPAAKMVPCSSVEVLSGYHTFGFGGIADQAEFVKALDEVASSPMQRQEMSRMGLELVSQPKYRWQDIANQFHLSFSGLLGIRESWRGQPKPPILKSEHQKLAEEIAA